MGSASGTESPLCCKVRSGTADVVAGRVRRVSEAVDRRHEQSGRVPLGQAPRRSFDHTQTTLGPGGFPQAGRRVVRDRAAESATGREGSDEGEGASDATSCLGSRQARRPCTLKPWRAHMDTPTHTSMAVTGWPAMHAPKHRRAHSRRAGGQAEAVGGRLAGWQAGRQAGRRCILRTGGKGPKLQHMHPSTAPYQLYQ